MDGFKFKRSSLTLFASPWSLSSGGYAVDHQSNVTLTSVLVAHRSGNWWTLSRKVFCGVAVLIIVCLSFIPIHGTHACTGMHAYRNLVRIMCYRYLTWTCRELLCSTCKACTDTCWEWKTPLRSDKWYVNIEYTCYSRTFYHGTHTHCRLTRV